MLVGPAVAVVAACGQAALAGVGCVQVALLGAVRCAQVALTGAVRSQVTVSRMLGLSRASRIQSQIGPTSAGLGGLMLVYLAGLATGPAGAGAAGGTEIIGQDM